MPPVYNDIPPEPEEENYVDHDVASCSYPHEKEVGNGTLN
jgi:hypothetical protein